MSGDYEQTLRQEIFFEGIGVHGGRPVRVRLVPAPPGAGIQLRRVDIEGSPSFSASVEHVLHLPDIQGRQTTLGRGGHYVVTVEHLLSSLYGLGVDNCLIEVSGEEMPVLDGSAREYVERIQEIGLVQQDRRRTVLEITEPLAFDFGGDTHVEVRPSEQFEISYTLSYPEDPSLAKQFARFVVSPEIYAREIALARTFCVKKEVDHLRARGYGKGATFDNTLVFDEGRPLQNHLRFDNEACRHKILDLIGDLSLLARRLKGHVVAYKTGHRQNVELVRRLKAMESKVPDMPREAQGSGASNGTEPPRRELDIMGIMNVIPHRYPFLLIDRIVDLVEGCRAVGIKNVTMNDYFFQGHFPGHPVMPGVLIVEAMAQVGGVVMLSKNENKGKLAYFMSIDSAKFRQPVFPGDQLRMEVEIMRVRSKTGQCRGAAYVKDKLVCEAEVKFALVDREG